MIGRIFWLGLVGALAVICFGVQLDRQTDLSIELSPSVPEIARSSAQLGMTAYALESGDASLALAEAERLVARRPMPAEHLRLLAQAQFAAGQLEQGGLTIQYAAQRGWRDPLAQEAMLRLALDAGDDAEASRRYAALLLRQATPDDLLEELGPQVLAASGGEARRVLTVIVSGGERWHGQFLRRASSVMPPDAFVEIVTGAMQQGTQFDCNVLRLAEDKLTARNPEAAAAFATAIDGQC